MKRLRPRYRKQVPMLALIEAPHPGRPYHVSWAYSRGIVGICISVDEKSKTVILRTPKTKKLFKNPVRWSDLRMTRSAQARHEKKQKAMTVTPTLSGAAALV